MNQTFRKISLVALSIIAVLIVGYIIILNLGTPLDNRDWAKDVLNNPEVNFDGDNSFTIVNVRNATYEGSVVSEPNYESRTYSLSDLVGIDYFVTPFGPKGVAHTILSFQFDNNSQSDYLALSVEARKEQGESYGLWRGMLNQYEIIYIWADESDVVRTRVEDRDSLTYRYHLDQIDVDNARLVLRQLLKRTNDLAVNPEFYHTIWNNCTIDLWRQINTVLPDQLPFTKFAILPERSGEFLHAEGLISDEQLLKAQQSPVPSISDIGRYDYSESIREK